MKKVYIKEEGLGCLNLVIWDFLTIAIFTGVYLHINIHLHTLFCIIAGVVAGAIGLCLFRIKYLGIILQIACGGFWGYFISSLIIEWFKITDPIWYWALIIGLVILFILIHFASTQELGGNYEYKNSIKQQNKFSKNLNYTTEENRYLRWDIAISDYQKLSEERSQLIAQTKNITYGDNNFSDFVNQNNDLWSELNGKVNNIVNLLKTVPSLFKEDIDKYNEFITHLQDMQGLNVQIIYAINNILSNSAGEQQLNNNTDIDRSLFAGCNDKESLTKRYKNLMKTFHPDNENGDTAMTVKIKKTYEILLVEIIQ